MKNKLVLVRHGQSEWNAKNLFTGSYDSYLTDKGKEEAKQTGLSLSHIQFKTVFSSTLVRAYDTARIIMENNDYDSPPIDEFDELKERDYGDLTGLNKSDLVQIHGAELVKIWRRDYIIKPPGGESLEDTFNRIVPFYRKQIVPKLDEGNVLVSAHGNSIRALMKYIEDIPISRISKVEVATGQPIIYESDKIRK